MIALRHLPIALTISFAGLAALGVGSACGGGDSGTGGSSCAHIKCPVDYSKFDGTQPAVSFATDVLPLFRRSCGLSDSCHGGSPTSGKASLYLGPKQSDPDPTAAEKQAIIDGIVGKPSKTAPSVNLVKASDPQNSFLMLKVDGCENSAGLTCTAQTGAVSGKSCGDNMPQLSDPLCDGERDTVRRWIAQGAQNN